MGDRNLGTSVVYEKISGFAAAAATNEFSGISTNTWAQFLGVEDQFEGTKISGRRKVWALHADPCGFRRLVREKRDVLHTAVQPTCGIYAPLFSGDPRKVRGAPFTLGLHWGGWWRVFHFCRIVLPPDFASKNLKREYHTKHMHGLQIEYGLTPATIHQTYAWFANQIFYLLCCIPFHILESDYIF